MTEGVKRTLLTILKIVLIILAIFIFTRLWKFIVPFIIAYFFASIIEPIVKFIENKLRIPRKIGTVFSILLVLGVIGSIIGFLISRFIKEIKAVYMNLEINMDTITEFFNRIIDKVNDIFIQLPDQITDLISQGLQDIAKNLQSVLGQFVNWVQASIQAAMYLPQILIFIIVTLLATYFMSSDKNTIIKFLDVHIPTDWLDKTKSITKNVFTALFGWLRAQLILTTVTFSELLVGFLIIGIDNAFLLALIISLVDVLPVLGAGTVLIPWSIINLIMGNAKLGLSTALLYVIILFVRQLIEPKVVGKQIGVHPLFTLAGMYIGLRLWKIPGMFIGPLAIVSLKYIFEGILKEDTFKQWVERNFKQKKKDTACVKADEEDEALKKT